MHHSRRVFTKSAHLKVAALALLSLALPAAAAPRAFVQEKTEAAKVAKKVENARHTQHQAKEDIEAIAKLQKALDRYAGLHDRLMARLVAEPPATAIRLTEALMAARSKSRPGDILLPDVQPLYKRLIAAQLSGPDATAARKAVEEGNPADDEPAVKVDVRVNAPYPAGAAHSTVPPSLLLSLPALPACLHYRFVGRDLILVDSVAQLIVDVLEAAAPATQTKKLP